MLGRAVSGDGRLTDDNELSRRHARISRGDTGVLAIEDLGSANGTFVNGQRITSRVVLTPGDSVRVGSTTIDVTDAASAALAASPPAAAPVAPPEPPRRRSLAGAATAPVAPPSRRRRHPSPRPSHARPRRHRSPPRRRRRRPTCAAPRRAPAPARRSDRGAGHQPAPRDRVRRLSRRGHHRPRGHGRRLPRRGAGAPARGGAQADPSRPLGGRARARALPARVEGRRRDRPPERHPDLRRGRGAGRDVHHDAARRRRRSAAR